MLESLQEGNVKRMHLTTCGSPGVSCPDSPARLLLQSLAETIQESIVKAHEFRLNYGETTITDFCLLEIARAKLKEISIVSARGLTESQCGFDWEWYVRYPKTKWFRFSVQAKKMDPEKGVYRSVRHRLRTGKFQIDMLDAFAKAHRTIPIYAFYNIRNWVSKPPSNCAMATTTFDADCTLVPLDDVRRAHDVRGRVDYASVHVGREMPWRCIVCPRVTTHWTPGPDAASSDERPLVHPLQAGDIRPELHDRLPPIIQRLLASSGDDAGVQAEELAHDEAYASELGALPKRIAVIQVEAAPGPPEPLNATPPMPETRAF